MIHISWTKVCSFRATVEKNAVGLDTKLLSKISMKLPRRAATGGNAAGGASLAGHGCGINVTVHLSFIVAKRIWPQATSPP
jgi:hypothetical protein